MDLEYMYGMMVESIKVIGKITKCMVEELILGKMEECTKVNT